MGRSHLEKVQGELGGHDGLVGGFMATHTTPPGVTAPGVPFPIDLVADLLNALLPSRRSWKPIDGLPTGRIAVGVTADQVLLGRRGKVFVRRDLVGAFGDASGPLGDAWVELCGVRLGVKGADADEALRLQRRSVLAAPRHPPEQR